MQTMKIIFAVLCFGIGVAFAVGTVAEFLHPNPYSYNDPPAWLLGMLAAMFLLGSFLLLRHSPSPQVPPVSPASWRFRTAVLSGIAALAVLAGVGIYVSVNQASVRQKAEQARLAQQQAEYERWATTAIRPGELSLTGVSLSSYNNNDWMLTGAVTNHSKFDVLQLGFLVTIKNCSMCEIIGQEMAYTTAGPTPLVPAGQMRSFSAGSIVFRNMGPSVSNPIKEWQIAQIRAARPLLSDAEVGAPKTEERSPDISDPTLKFSPGGGSSSVAKGKIR